MIYNKESGSLVCNICGVEHESNIIDDHFESRNFISENTYYNNTSNLRNEYDKDIMINEGNLHDIKLKGFNLPVNKKILHNNFKTNPDIIVFKSIRNNLENYGNKLHVNKKSIDKSIEYLKILLNNKLLNKSAEKAILLILLWRCNDEVYSVKQLQNFFGLKLNNKENKKLDDYNKILIYIFNKVPLEIFYKSMKFFLNYLYIDNNLIEKYYQPIIKIYYNKEFLFGRNIFNIIGSLFCYFIILFKVSFTNEYNENINYKNKDDKLINFVKLKCKKEVDKTELKSTLKLLIAKKDILLEENLIEIKEFIKNLDEFKNF